MIKNSFSSAKFSVAPAHDHLQSEWVIKSLCCLTTKAYIETSLMKVHMFIMMAPDKLLGKMLTNIAAGC